ncbi:MAG: EAL domain-containing protein [Lachnospiraceae bacterium]|nr:EAL domain-containing protein [Lachnospiraceae bacterium]
MNIQMQIGGLLVLFLLQYFYSRQEVMGLYTEKLFKRALNVTIACLILDILSIVLIVNRDMFPLWLVNLECKAYLISLIGNGYMALIYACSDIYHKETTSRYANVLGAVVLMMSIVILAIPIHIFCEGNVAYTYGPACIATYVGALSLLLGTLYIITKNRRIMTWKRRRAIMIWLGMWIVAALIQFFFNQLLLVGFTSALGMVILFFELENPEANIDRKTGVFNRYAFADYMKQKYREEEDFCAILVILKDRQSKEVKADQLEAAILKITQFLRSSSAGRIFKTDDKEFSIVFNSHEELRETYVAIESRFRKGWLQDDDLEGFFLQPSYLAIPSKEVAENERELLELLKFFKTHHMNSPEERIFVLNKDSIVQKRIREQILTELKAAMDEERVEVFFQPIYSIHQDKFVAAEALVRIRKEDGSILMPNDFIPAAEETGQISRLGEIVFARTCRFIKENDIRRYGLEYIEVNLSVIQCESKDLSANYIEIMKRYEVDPALINLEITESASIVMKSILIDNMNAMIKDGIAFSLDDFGNGQSNLNYIVDMPVEIVKFDRNMTKAYFESEKAKFVLQATVNMIHEMNLKVVSEGVETAEQLTELKKIGIDYIQGFYFSRPLQAEKFIEFLKENNK